MHHVFVLGLDEFNAEKMQATTRARDCAFIPLLEYEDVRGLDEFRFEGLLALARAQLAESPQPPAAVCSFWDFPVIEMVPVLADEYGLSAPSLDSIVRVHHKYWSRLLQSQVVPEVVPDFCAVDPFATGAPADIELDYPFWLKPVRSFRSQLAFHVRDRRELGDALDRIRHEIGRLAKPYAEVLDRVRLPGDVEGVDGWWCIAEQAAAGRQCTVEGYVHRGECVVYGIVDSVRDANRTSFRRYEYPSRLPRSARRRMVDVSTKVMDALEFDGAPFNIEFFWDRRDDRIWLLEVNARQSQSHADLFEKVDGVPNHQVMVDLALGERPAVSTGRGGFGAAAKWFVRAWEDGVVTRVPTAGELAALHDRFPEATVLVEVGEGDRLRDLPDQDAYSYELAVVYSGARSHRELLSRHRDLLAELPLEVKPA